MHEKSQLAMRKNGYFSHGDQVREMGSRTTNPPVSWQIHGESGESKRFLHGSPADDFPQERRARVKRGIVSRGISRMIICPLFSLA
jgi:hypothetical protein